MNTAKILQNSWNLMLRYRALWIFGVLLALTTLSVGSSLWLRDSRDEDNRNPVLWEISAKDQAWIKKNFGLDLPLRYSLKFDGLDIHLDDPSLSPQERARLISIATRIFIALLVLWTVNRVLRYTSETALIRMVNDQHYDDQKRSARQGWALGFSKAALKLFLIDLLVYPLLILISVLIFIPASLPVLIAISGTPSGITLGILLMLSLTLASAAALIVIWIAGLLTLKLAYRACCLEGLDVFASIWRGFRLMCRQLQGVGLTGLVILGLDLAYPILVAPIAILLAAAGLLVSGILALSLGALLALVTAKTTAWTIAVIVGLVLLALAFGAPMALLGGLREIFKSSAWTLTFREAANQQNFGPAPAPQPILPQPGTA